MAIERVTGVLVCGNICLDIPVWAVDTVDWGTTAWVDAITESVGGNGANTSYALATLGVPVRLTGTVGKDRKGEWLVETLQAADVDASRISRSEHPTTSTVVLVQSSGNRTFLHRPGSSGDVLPEDVRFDDLAGFSHFHLANPFALPRLREEAGSILRRAKAAGLTTSLDTGWDARGAWMQVIGPCLPSVNLLFLNEEEAMKLTGAPDVPASVAALRSGGATDIVVKAGANGCVVFSGQQRLQVPGFPVKVVDTTGAGDCFAGAFLAALARDWNYEEAARFANAVGACNVQELGAAKGVLPFEATLTWMRERDTL